MAPNKSIVILTAAVIGIVASAAPAHAGIFGHSKKWKAQQAAIQAQQQADAERAYQESLRAQQQQTYQQQPYQQPTYQPAPPPPPQYRPAPQYQPAPQPTYQQPAYRPAPQPAVDSSALGEVDSNGVPLYNPDGTKMSDKDRALWPFRHQPAQYMPVYITQHAWTPAIEDQFSNFVAQFGAGVKAKPMHLLNFYMHDPTINPYASSDPAGVYYYSDCADLPYFLRAYFAYKNGLPMGIAAGITMNMRPYASLSNASDDAWSMANPDRTDVSPYGNSLTGRGRSNLPTAPGKEKNFLAWWSYLMDAGSTRTFMVSPFTPNYQMSDVYPAKIDHNGIRPGSLVHSDGHMLVVTAVHANGDIELIDAHPDNSLQFKTLDPSKLMRDRPDRAYGFFRFRPTQAVGGQWRQVAGQNALYGARLDSAKDYDLYNEGVWSVEQWMGPGLNISPGQAVDPNQWKRGYEDSLEFFFYLRGQLATTVESSDDAASDLLESLCTDIKQRVADVDAASPYVRRPHPDTLPKNIYLAEPTWENFATPSRDARVRQAIINLPDLIRRYFHYGSQNKYKLTYNGSSSQYQSQILAKWAQLDQTCKLTYKNSAGQPVTIGFSEIVNRAPRMSFDYADCPEKRWGASDEEIARTCRDGDPSGRWYKAEQSMRNIAAKTQANGKLTIRSDRPITLQMLESQSYLDQPSGAAINLGSAKSRQPNVKSYFSSPQFVQDLGR